MAKQKKQMDSIDALLRSVLYGLTDSTPGTVVSRHLGKRETEYERLAKRLSVKEWIKRLFGIR